MQILKSFSVVKPLDDWQALPAGTKIQEAVQAELDRWLPMFHGQFMLKIGALSNDLNTQCAPITHQFYVNKKESVSADVVAKSRELPFASDTIDTIIAALVLDYTRYPHQVLREMHRCLDGEGYLVLVNFNPWSFWGAGKLLMRFTESPLWKAGYYSPFRIHDWLNLLGFELVSSKFVGYTPPFRNLHWESVEWMGSKYMPGLGAINIIVAKKKMYRVIPLKSLWKKRSRLIVGQLT
ncbi:MAG: methyltransferase domain-containing protein [Pseudomonadota bacterium]